MINLAILKSYNRMTAMEFMEVLRVLNWTKGQGMLYALSFFNGLNNNACYCPTISKLFRYGSEECLKMTWDSDPFVLDILCPYSGGSISYFIGRKKNIPTYITCTYEDTFPLVAYWANYLNQTVPSVPTKGKAICRPDVR